MQNTTWGNTTWGGSSDAAVMSARNFTTLDVRNMGDVQWDLELNHES